MTKARSNATANAAKGDLTVGNGTNLSGVLAVGNNGDTIVADSSTATGLRYQASTAAGRNFLINGGMDIWQRGTSVAFGSGPQFLADRFQCNRQGNVGGATASRQTASLTGFEYSLRIQRDSGNTSTNYLNWGQNLENVNSIPLAGQTVSLSFWAKAGANYSGASNQLSPGIFSGTGTNQNYITAGGFTGGATVVSTNVTLTTSWQRFTVSGNVGSSATQLAIQFLYFPTGTAGANDWVEITGVMLSVGSVAEQFTRAGGTIQGELAACQRYYWRAGLDSSGLYGILGNSGYTDSTTNSNVMFNLPVHMRVTPTAIDYPTLSTTRILNVGNPFTPTAASLNTTNTTADIGWVNFTSSGMTSGQFSQYTKSNNAAAFIGFSAEL